MVINRRTGYLRMTIIYLIGLPIYFIFGWQTKKQSTRRTYKQAWDF